VSAGTPSAAPLSGLSHVQLKVSDPVADAIAAMGFRVFPHPDFVDVAERRWAPSSRGGTRTS